MISAERIMEYGSLDSEASLETHPPNKKPHPDWPENGEIVMENVCFRYSIDSPVVLKSLSCHIRPTEKVYTCSSIHIKFCDTLIHRCMYHGYKELYSTGQ